MDDLGEKAQAQYDDAPMLFTLGYLLDMRDDLEGFGDTPDPFLEGYKYAISHVAQMYLQYSGVYICQCKNGTPFPEQLSGGTWHCAFCGVELADSTNALVPDEGVESGAGVNDESK